MTTAVLVPFKGGEEHRDRNWSWVRCRYEQSGFEVIEGTSDAEGFSRTQGILSARAQSDADVFVVADADVWCDPAALLHGAAQAQASGWAVPNGMLRRLSEESTWRVLSGENWRGLALSTDNPQDSLPYPVHEAGTLLILTAEAFDIAPPDPRFIGWGFEDDAWAMALNCLVGPAWRGAADLIHLWHPAAPRPSRTKANPSNTALRDRYRAAARRGPVAMRRLIEEVSCAATPAGDDR